MIAHLIEALQKSIGLEPTAEEIADLLWFASHLDEAKRKVYVVNKQVKRAHRPQQASSKPPQPNEAEASTSQTETGRADVHLPKSDASEPISGLRGLSFRSSAVFALPGAREIERSLRPLMRRVPSRTHLVLDEEATVEQIADEGNWMPVLRPALSRWLEVALVVDEWPSMDIWRQTIAEWQRLLERLGAFRHVQSWGFTTDRESHQVRLHIGTGPKAAQGRTCHPRELIDPGEQRLILVVSDCVSPAWDNGAVARMLAIWGEYGPVAIVQMLPERLWLRSALGNALSVHLHAPTPCIPNSQLEVELPWDWFDEEAPAGIPLPIVTLEAHSLAPWAQSVAGWADLWIAGVILPTEPSEQQDSEEQERAPLSPTERLQLFEAVASPLAWRLAGYLAAAPLSLPVMRLVQRVMLPDSRQVHLAEVFLSGLIKRQTAYDPTIHPDDVRYDFVDGVRDLLLSTILISDWSEVLSEVSNFYDQQTGHPLDFRALIADPTATGRVVIEEDSKPFATVAAKVLRRLGGKYAQLATRLEERIERLEPPPATLEELIQREPDCASVIQRHALAQEIIHCFEKTDHFVVLYGQPMVGKTKLLLRVSKMLADEYVPLMVTGQGMQLSNTLHDFDAFIFEFTEQLSNKFGEWAARHGLSRLEPPRRKDFRKKGRVAFERVWKDLREIAKPCQPLIIVDEVERLLDFAEIDPRILSFLDYFVTNPENGCFILAGSEQIRSSENKTFNKLIAKGTSFPVQHYDGTMVSTLFSHIQKYLTYEDDVLRYCLALCNGHPRILFVMINTTLGLISRNIMKKSIERRDFEQVLTIVLERLNEFLWALGKRLSKQEIFAIQLITDKISGPIDKPPEIYLHELVTLAEHQYPNSSKNFERLILKGVADLHQREWLEWKDWQEKLFRFKLGIFIEWIHRYQIRFDEVIP